MIITAHVLAGGVAGKILNNPLEAFLFGILLHFVLDTIPHFDDVRTDKKSCKWNTAQWVLSITDGIIALFLMFWLGGRITFTSPFYWGALGGILPDLLDNVPFWNAYFQRTSFGKVFHRFHDRLHFLRQDKMPWLGVMTQATVIAVSLYLFFK